MGCSTSRAKASHESEKSTKETVKETTIDDDKLWAQRAVSAPQDQQAVAAATMQVEDAEDEVGRIDKGKSKPQAPTITTVVPSASGDQAPHTHAIGLNDNKEKKQATVSMSLPGGVEYDDDDDDEEVAGQSMAVRSQKPDRNTRKSQSTKAQQRKTQIFGPSGPKSQELAQLLSDLEAYKKTPPLQMKEVGEKKAKAKALANSGVKPCACCLFFFQVDTDHSEMLDRAELQMALWRIPNFNNALFEFKISELFSEGDGWLDLDEWLDLAEELPDLKAEIEKEEICRSWRDLLL